MSGDEFGARFREAYNPVQDGNWEWGEVSTEPEGQEWADLAAGDVPESLRGWVEEKYLNGTPEDPRRMKFYSLSEVRRRVESQSADFLIDTLWPEGDYGVIGAEDKAGKTWAAGDLGISVSSGTPWQGRYEVKQGPVLFLHGEGGERNLIRRLDAICRSRDLSLDDLEADGLVRISLRVPRLDNATHLEDIRKELEQHSPRVVLLDPLYLAVPGRRGADLYAMGESLGSIQVICQEAGSALAVNTHWNKTGEGTGAARFTGVGPGAWGRVLGSAAVEQRHTEPDKTTIVSLLWEFVGGEIPDLSFRTRRKVWTDNPSDLNSPMHYEIEVTEEGVDALPAGLSPSEKRVLAALRACKPSTKTVQTIGDGLAKDGHGMPLKPRTIQNALKKLLEDELINGVEEQGKAGEWWVE